MHSGYQESFMAVDMNSIRQDANHKASNGDDGMIYEKENCNLSWKNSQELYKENVPLERKSSMKKELADEKFFDTDKIRKYSLDDGMMREPEMRKRTLSLMMERMDGIYI